MITLGKKTRLWYSKAPPMDKHFGVYAAVICDSKSCLSIDHYYQDEKGDWWLDIVDEFHGSVLEWEQIYNNKDTDRIFRFLDRNSFFEQRDLQSKDLHPYQIIKMYTAHFKVMQYVDNNGKVQFLFLLKQNGSFSPPSNQGTKYEHLKINDASFEKGFTSISEDKKIKSHLNQFYHRTNGVTFQDVTRFFKHIFNKEIELRCRLNHFLKRLKYEEKGYPISQFLAKQRGEPIYITPSAIVKPNGRTLICEYAFYKEDNQWRFTEIPERHWSKKDVIIVFIRKNKPEIYESFYKTAGSLGNAKELQNIKFYWWNCQHNGTGSPVEIVEQKRLAENQAFTKFREMREAEKIENIPTPLQILLKKTKLFLSTEKDPLEQALLEIYIDDIVDALEVI